MFAYTDKSMEILINHLLTLLSQTDRMVLRVVEYFAKSLKVI